MIKYLFGCAAILGIAALGWMSFNLMLENDGLRQVDAEHRRSTKTLLSYIQTTTKCDVDPQALAKALAGTLYRDATGVPTDVSKLAFKAEFKDGKVRSVEVVNVGKVSLCGGA
jgi:hypothetical protein